MKFFLLSACYVFSVVLPARIFLNVQRCLYGFYLSDLLLPFLFKQIEQGWCGGQRHPFSFLIVLSLPDKFTFHVSFEHTELFLQSLPS